VTSHWFWSCGLDEVVKLTACSREVSGSNIGHYTNCLDGGFFMENFSLLPNSAEKSVPVLWRFLPLLDIALVILTLNHKNCRSDALLHTDYFHTLLNILNGQWNSRSSLTKHLWADKISESVKNYYFMSSQFQESRCCVKCGSKTWQ
jgi:hypothetical protein